MTTVTEIKAAIESLSPREYCELMAMLHPTVDDDWDRQMKADAASDLARTPTTIECSECS